MHEAVMRFVAEHCAGHYENVVEVGSRNMNGTARVLIDADDYLGVDRFDGPCVDLVADARDIDYRNVDLVLCLEVLEHDPAPFALAAHLAGWLRPGGLLVLTCATDPRAPHGADMGPDEHYGNVDPDGIRDALAGFGWFRAVEVDRTDGDLRIVLERRHGDN